MAAGRAARPERDRRKTPNRATLRKTVQIGSDLEIGDDHFVVMAGPCAVETADQLGTVALAVAAAGASMLRGGAFKPRTSPRSFQGLGRAGLELLAEASRRTGLPVVTEVMDPRDVALVAGHAAMLQIGSRSMQNFPLLREVGKAGVPVLLKRGAAATIEELVLASEYVRGEGNDAVVLCERGVRSFDPSTRYLLDLAAVPLLRERTDLPVIVDPSHGTGRSSLVAPMAKAALVAGADGLLIDVHAAPETALCDGQQALRPAEFAELMAELRRLVPLCRRRWSRPAAADRLAPTPLDDEVIAP
ncbi:MAG: 3-deoxy-7-phosphoheptulonate synthase [Planctomycetes bacterium]|nr:3-deoxy-7-phosphoheptulonate synthase [Planctomycetota bacterium]